MTAFAPVGGFLLVLVLIAMLPVIGHLIMGPVNRAAGRLRAPTRFQLSDFLWLLLQLQGCLALTVQFIGIKVVGLFLPILAFLVFATASLWAGAISYLSRAAITDPWRRACFTLLVMPGTLTLMISVPLLATTGSVAAIAYIYGIAEGRDFNPVFAATRAALGVAVAIGVLIGGWIMRRLAIWVAAGSMDTARVDATI